MSTTFPDRLRGFSIVAAIFILVVLSALAAFVVSVTTTQNLTLATDVTSARAYLAARAGIEYGLQRWLVSGSCSTATLSIEGFSVTLTASQSPNTPATTDIEFCTLTSTAKMGTLGSVGYIERSIRIVAEAG